MPNDFFQPEGYNNTRDAKANSFASLLSSDLSNTSRDWRIECSNNSFTFVKWLSKQANFLRFPYQTSSNPKSTLITSPTFVVDAGDYLEGNKSNNFPFIWLFVKSTDTDPNNNIIYARSNATTLGTVTKAGGSLNYTFKQNEVQGVVAIGDYVYLSFSDTNNDIRAYRNLITPYANWYGSFFRVTGTGSDQITLVEDASIYPSLYPKTNSSYIIKSYDEKNALSDNYCMMYDLGWSFNRTSIPSTTYYRVIGMTIDQDAAKFPQSHEYNGIIYSSNNFSPAGADLYLRDVAGRYFVTSYMFPISKRINWYIKISQGGSNSFHYTYQPLGTLYTTDINDFNIGATGTNLTMTCSSSVYGLPIIIGNVGINSQIEVKAIDCDYLGRI